MRNYICYWSGKMEIIRSDGTVDYSEFIAAENKKAFEIAAQFAYDQHSQFFPLDTMRLEGQKMYFRMDKASVLWVLNGCTKNGDVQGTGSLPAPAYRGQFDRQNPDFTPYLELFFVADSPRRFRRAV